MLAWVFLGGPLDPHLPRQGVQIQSLVGELRCHVPGGQINKIKNVSRAVCVPGILGPVTFSGQCEVQLPVPAASRGPVPCSARVASGRKPY